MSEVTEDVIREALDDATAVPEAEAEGATPVTEEASTPVTEDLAATPAATETPEATPTTPAATQEAVDEFVKELGDQFKKDGRENRIPYSRVKSIVENAKKKASTEFETNLKSYGDKLAQYEPIVQKQAELDRVIFNEPQKFLDILRTIPGYSQLLGGGGNVPAAAPQAPNPAAQMPQPDLQLSDGSKTYSMDGLKALMDWQAAQVEARVRQHYEPIERSFASAQQMQALLPKVQAQIAEASKWPLFNESQADILKALQADQSLSLERAYQSVVLPKLQANRDRMRAEIISEVNKQPRSTATTPLNPVAANPDATPRSTEDIIRDVMKTR